jgi:hypothetical protein
MLAAAEAGTLRAIAWVSLERVDGREMYATGWLGFSDKIEVLGHLTALSHHVVTAGDSE